MPDSVLVGLGAVLTFGIGSSIFVLLSAKHRAKRTLKERLRDDITSAPRRDSPLDRQQALQRH